MNICPNRLAEAILTNILNTSYVSKQEKKTQKKKKKKQLHYLSYGFILWFFREADAS